MKRMSCAHEQVQEVWPALHIVGQPAEVAMRPPRTWIIYDDEAGGVEVLVGDMVRLWVQSAPNSPLTLSPFSYIL